MTVESTFSRVQYAGNGAATEFAVPWQFLADDHVAAVLTSAGADTALVQGVDYALAGAGDTEGGTLTCPLAGDPLAPGQTLTIHAAVPLTQERAWSNTDAIDVTEIEKADDKLTRICQQLSEELGRCLKYPVTSTDPDTNLGAVTAAADQALASAAAAAGSASDAEDARDEAVAAVAGLDIPAIGAGDGGKPLFSKTDESGYELKVPSDARAALGLGPAALEDVAAGGTGDLLRSDGDGSALTGITAMPAGAVVWFAGGTAPSGYLKADGAAVSRTTYAALFAAIGTTFGAGDGSTTFALPDLRGEFVRGWDDGRGADPGRSLGSSQSDAFESHTHTVPYQVRTMQSSGENEAYEPRDGTHDGTITTSSTGDSETRPRNVALLACIKY